ncbi:biogenesis of lysosome-related organelles complex 1 subunit 5-like [Mya arenaria]|uniref:biogenesis of lysosome-related organelles complex 1 subunit 5-like n=1 Tax=Mya arenaria TaxID=6604 RepID=UPI0022E418A3|nr:biogenesis of lysosome-related organelles complex 1 subunit 5-like [Mya arenaria]
MVSEQIIRDVFEVHGRLFDHKPVLQGHIKAFVREFEEKRGGREVEQLEKISGQVLDIKDKYLEEMKTALDTFLTNIQAKASVAVEVCKKIEEKENNVDVGQLELERDRRKREWDTFMQKQFERSAEVDRDMDAEMKKVAEEYVEMEKKLQQQYVTST